MTGFIINNSNNLGEQLRDLAIRAQRGDKTAYAELLNLLYPYIRSIVRRKLGPIVDHEDLTQECLLGIHKNLATYHPSKPFRPWLSAIIRYKVADYFKLLAKRKELPLEDDHAYVTKEGPIKNDYVRPSGKEAVEVLSALPEKLRQALHLTQLQGLSYEQAAQQEGVTEVALRKRVSRAYGELRTIAAKKLEINFDD